MDDLKKLLAEISSPSFFLGILTLLMLAALTYSVTASWKVYRHEPLAEAASRSLMAVNSSFFYDSGLAEPLPVFSLKLAMAAGADPDTAVRAWGMAVFIALVLVTVFVLRRRFGGQCAIMAALFLAANPFMCYYAMQGGSHLYALLFLVLFWHYFDPPEPSRKAALLAGLYGGLACLSRLDAAWALLLIAALSWAVRRGRFGLKAAGLSLGLALALTLPYTLYQRAEYGNSLYAQELGLRRWANIDKYAYGSWAGAPKGPLSVPGYLFRDGALAAARSAFRGLGRSFSYELPRTLYYKPLLVFLFLGTYSAFILKKYRLLFFLAAALLPALPLAAVKQVPSTGGIEPRYYLWSLWALCGLVGLGFQETLSWVEGSIVKWAAEKKAASEKNKQP